MIEVSEKDWKLFRKQLPGWQESYIEKLNQEYIEILNSPEVSSEKFWKLEKRIKNDKRKIGVVCDMRRSKMIENIVSLLAEKVITTDDLSAFSDDLKSMVKMIFEFYT